MTAREAGKIVREHVGDAYKVSAREVSFEDLARGSRVFVTIKGAPSYADRAFWDGVQDLGREHGISIGR